MTQDESSVHHGGMMKKDGRNSVEETIIEEVLSEKELETLLVGFLEALEREQRLKVLPPPPKNDQQGDVA